MKKLRLIAAKTQKDELLEKLMLLGCVELDSQDFMFDDPILSKLVSREFSDSTPYRTQRQIFGEALRVLDKYASHRISTIAPQTIPATAPLYVKRFQKSDNRITGPNAAPKSAHALETRFMIACAPSPLLDAMKYATIDTITTTMRPTHKISLSDAFLRIIGL